MNVSNYICDVETFSAFSTASSMFLHSVCATVVFTNLSLKAFCTVSTQVRRGTCCFTACPQITVPKADSTPCVMSQFPWKLKLYNRNPLADDSCVIGGPFCVRIVVLTPSRDFQLYFLIVHILFLTQLQIDYYLLTCWGEEGSLVALYLGHRRSDSGKNDWLFLHWISSRDTVAYHKASSVLLLRGQYQSRPRLTNEKLPIIRDLGSIFPLYASECLFKRHYSI